MVLLGTGALVKNLNFHIRLLSYSHFNGKGNNHFGSSNFIRSLSRLTPSQGFGFGDKEGCSNRYARKLFDLLKVGETVSLNELVTNIGSSGIRINDPRLVVIRERAEEKRLTTDLDKMDFETFKSIISGKEDLIHKAICDDFVIPDFSLFCKHLNDIYQECRTNSSGTVSHWPYPENTSQYFSYGINGSDYWGVSMCTVDGQRHDIGDFDVLCPLHSCSWPFNYAFAVKRLGFGEVHRFIDKELACAHNLASGSSGSLHCSIPLNIMGSLLVSSLMLKCSPSEGDKFSEILNDYKQLLGGNGGLKFSKEVFDVAHTWSHKTKSVAHHLANGNLFPEGFQLDDCVTLQLQTNCLSVDVQSGALMAATLANYGRCPIGSNSCSPTLEPLAARNILTYMQSSSQFSRSVRLPVVSSLSGMTMVVVNGVMGLCLWSPSLDKFGNSVRSLQFCKELAKRFSVHKFNSSSVKSQQIYLGGHKSFARAALIGQMMYCAYRGDKQSLERLCSSGVKADLSDYDGRTALHVASSEGHLDCVKFLVDVCQAPLDAIDRWGNTPLNEAQRHQQKQVQSFLESRAKSQC